MRALWILALLGCASTPRPEALAPKPDAAAKPDALARLNQEARDDYAQARSRALAAAGPVLWVGTEQLVLLRNGARQGEPLIPDGYTALKSVAHVALGLHALLGEGPVDAARVQRFRNALLAARQERTGLTAAQEQREDQILGSALALLDGPQSRDALLRWERGAAGLLLENAADAARAQLALLHREVTALRAQLSPAEWSALHVVVAGSHMARDGELKLQYFERLLREPFEGGRIIYAEGLFTEQQGLDLLATHLIDARLSTALFGDPLRMHRDLLSDEAARDLPDLLPR